MNASELKDKLDMYISHGHENDEVIIHCREASMGISAGEPVSGIYSGFDWDAGRLLIEPEKALIHYGSGRDDPIPVLRITYKDNYGGKIRPTLHCPRCEAKLTRRMQFCPKCGQMLDMKHMKEITI